MNTGNQNQGLTQTFPEDTIQGLLGKNWWEHCPVKDDNKYLRGRLVSAFIPFIDKDPAVLIGEREDPVKHDTVNAVVQKGNPRQIPRKKLLPVAAFPKRTSEIHTVYTSKMRPALVLSDSSDKIEKSIGLPAWQKNRYLLIAPYYGVEQDGSRAGIPREFKKRIQYCCYKQFMWDCLPHTSKESFLRFDQIQAIGRNKASIDILPYKLSKEAVAIVDQWLKWIFKNELDFEKDLGLFRSVMMDDLLKGKK